MVRDGAQTSDATLRLLLARGLGPVTMQRLRAHFGSDEAAVSAPVAALAAVQGVGMATAQALRRALDAVDPESERRALRRGNGHLVVRGDDDYPPLLGVIPDPPKALWVCGRLPAAATVAIVGSRRCSAYGLAQTGRLADALSRAGLVIVSGGARGIDAAAHEAAVRAESPTIAVLGCGLGVPYPAGHARLFERVVATGGAVVSELPMTTPPRAKHFPRRNRIISGLSAGVLVVEARRRSGALITARLAAEDHGREVMAVPGRVDSPTSAGCLELIRAGGAALVRDPADVIEQLASARMLVRGAREAERVMAEAPAPAPPDLSEAERRVLDALDGLETPASLDALAMQVDEDVAPLMAQLTLMEIRGLVRRGPRGVERRPHGG